jgi:hypothetical protein
MSRTTAAIRGNHGVHRGMFLFLSLGGFGTRSLADIRR